MAIELLSIDIILTDNNHGKCLSSLLGNAELELFQSMFLSFLEGHKAGILKHYYPTTVLVILFFVYIYKQSCDGDNNLLPIPILEVSLLPEQTTLKNINK